MSEKIIVSFSGGRTSAYMGWWLKHHTEHELKFIYANTGSEHEDTLKFVDLCAKEWGIDIVWVEAAVNPEHGKGTRHKVVTYETASRNGEPFEDVIRKYGISNQAYPHCTRELKLAPMQSYVKKHGWEGQWAIGIRSDEVDRISAAYRENNLIYPLITMHPTTRDDISQWWTANAFDLEVVEPYGNCVWCWKKSFRKLSTIAQQNPQMFEFPARMEAEYGLAGHNIDGNPRTFFRTRMTTQDVLALNHEQWSPSTATQPDMFWDETGGCSESCEVFS